MSARVIMVASGKGGTGKSTVSVLTGAALAARGRRVLLVELDSALRSVDYIAGVYGKTVYDVEDVLCGRCDAGKALVESPLYPVEIYNAFFSETAGGDYGFACATAVIAILITTVVFLVQKRTSNRFSFTMNALHPIERKKAKGPFSVLIHIFAYGVVGVAFLPQIYILYTLTPYGT